MQFIYRRIARLLTAQPHITKALFERAQKTPYSTLMSRDGTQEYMRRWWLFNPYQNADGTYPKRNWLMRLLPSVRFHEILLPDNDLHLHDHPWNAQTIVLRGWYIEEVENPDYEPTIVDHPSNKPTMYLHRQAGYTGPIRFGQYHRIASVSASRRQQTLTLFITFRHKGTWGFRVNGVKVPWRQYLGVDKRLPRQNNNKA